MTQATRKYVQALEFAVLGGVAPVVHGYLDKWANGTKIDEHLLFRAVVGAALVSAYAFVRANPLPSDGPVIVPITPPPFNPTTTTKP